MRLYSVSHRILRERDAYYRALENATRRGTCDITAWLSWFAQCLGRAMDDALEALSVAEQNAALRERAGQLPLNHRQLRVLELLIREPEETLTATRWARINHSTREEAEADTDGMDGMVRAMLLEEAALGERQPHGAGSHAAGDGEGRIEYRATGHLTEQQHRRTERQNHRAEITSGPLPRTAPTKSRRKPPSRPKNSRPEKDAGTVQDRRSDRGGNRPGKHPFLGRKPGLFSPAGIR